MRTVFCVLAAVVGLMGLACGTDPMPIDSQSGGGSPPDIGTGGCGPGLIECNGVCAFDCYVGCSPGSADCNGDPSDGCETYLEFDADHCGACGVGCPAPPNTNSSCHLSECETPSCVLYFLDCNEDLSDGCEVSKQDDPDNCGGCGMSCPAGLMCVKGNCTGSAIATGLSSPVSLTVLGDTIYWINAGTSPAFADGTLMSIGVDGTGQETLATGLAWGVSIAADSSAVYFSVRGTSPDFADGAIMRMPLSGGAPEQIAAVSHAGMVVVDSANVYWSTFGASDGAILSMPLLGGSVTTLAASQAAPYAIAVDASNVYWASMGDGALWKAPLDGGAATMLANSDVPQAIAVDASSLYWTSAVRGSVNRVPLVGGAPEVLSSGASSPYPLVLDGGDVLFGTFSLPYGIHSVPSAGGMTTTLASPPNRVAAIAVDSTHVYWLETVLNGAEGALVKLAK